MAESERLSGLQSHKDVVDVRPYSNLLRLIRAIIVIGVILILAVLIAWPQLSSIETSPLSAEDVKALKQAETENTLLRPVFNSTDSKGNPMVITADQAKQYRDADNIVILNAPQAQLSTDGGTPVHIQANSGIFDQNTETLELNEDIILDMDQGTITGGKLLIDQQKQTITFQGQTKAVIHNKKTDHP